MGTFGGALEARQINASQGLLTAEATGEIEKEDGVLVIRRIHVVYTLEADEAQRETIERVFQMHARYCPVYRSLYRAIEITTEYRLKQKG